jgi:hypothetical protein
LDIKTKMIKQWCEDELAYKDLTPEVQEILYDNGLVNENGEPTTSGELYKEAVTAKPDPNSKPLWNPRL